MAGFIKDSKVIRGGAGKLVALLGVAGQKADAGQESWLNPCLRREE